MGWIGVKAYAEELYPYADAPGAVGPGRAERRTSRRETEPTLFSEEGEQND